VMSTWNLGLVALKPRKSVTEKSQLDGRERKWGQPVSATLRDGVPSIWKPGKWPCNFAMLSRLTVRDGLL
jgi:hypothetical protein